MTWYYRFQMWRRDYKRRAFHRAFYKHHGRSPYRGECPW